MIRVREGTIDEIVATSHQIPELENPYPREEYEKRFSVDHLILVAVSGEEIVGFKCGYDRDGDKQKFYSWMGGVLPGVRNKGVAKMLLQEMEQWCRSKGRKTLEFKTLNEHKAMLTFAINQGFEIIDVMDSIKDDRKRILLRKVLSE